LQNFKTEAVISIRQPAERDLCFEALSNDPIIENIDFSSQMLGIRYGNGICKRL